MLPQSKEKVHLAPGQAHTLTATHFGYSLRANANTIRLFSSKAYLGSLLAIGVEPGRDAAVLTIADGLINGESRLTIASGYEYVLRLTAQGYETLGVICTPSVSTGLITEALVPAEAVEITQEPQPEVSTPEQEPEVDESEVAVELEVISAPEEQEQGIEPVTPAVEAETTPAKEVTEDEPSETAVAIVAKKPGRKPKSVVTEE